MTAPGRWALGIYRFVVGDPVLLGGAIVALVLAFLLRGLGIADGAFLFAAVCAVLCVSLGDGRA